VIPKPLFTEAQIGARVNDLAVEIASGKDRPDVAAPVLTGAFVFAADLLRALAARGLSLPVEFLWLRSYGQAREPSERITVLVAPSQAIQGRHVLLIDGVLDHGHTLAQAAKLLMEAGARQVTTAVAVDKRRNDALMRADHAAFTHVDRFIVGYGMDDGGEGRALPYIGTLD
jgi:hypoxanthine phosphoribosyltransferase